MAIFISIVADICVSFPRLCFKTRTLENLFLLDAHANTSSTYTLSSEKNCAVSQTKQKTSFSMQLFWQTGPCYWAYWEQLQDNTINNKTITYVYFCAFTVITTVQWLHLSNNSNPLQKTLKLVWYYSKYTSHQRANVTWRDWVWCHMFKK